MTYDTIGEQISRKYFGEDKSGIIGFLLNISAYTDDELSHISKEEVEKYLEDFVSRGTW